MMVLGIDTSAVTCSAALLSEDRVLSSFSVSCGLTHSETLLPGIQKVLSEAKVSLDELKAIAVTCGPGSFTGLRIGISTVKGLAYAEKIPCVPVSTLEALSYNAKEMEGMIVCALMDARRSEFYNGIFRIENGVPKRMTPDRAIAGTDLCSEIRGEERLVILGDGAEKFCEQNPEFLPFLAEPALRMQSAVSVAQIGLREINFGHAVPCEMLSPSYLRLPQAEREWLAKNQSCQKNQSNQ